MKTGWIVLVGNLADGFEAVGPFSNEETANEYATNSDRQDYGCSTVVKIVARDV